MPPQPVHLLPRLTPRTAFLLATSVFLCQETYRLSTGTHTFFSPRVPALRAALMGEDPHSDEVKAEVVKAYLRMRRISVREDRGKEGEVLEERRRRRRVALSTETQAQKEATREAVREEAPSIQEVIKGNTGVATPVISAPTPRIAKHDGAEEEVEAETQTAKRRAVRSQKRAEEEKKDWLEVESEGLTWVGRVPLILTPIPSLRLLMRPFRRKRKEEEE
ncbi:uncharacterized protein EI97DRAFT_499541 [Westerdykella ornata]|uniref:Uncharacterized protein n=1 Tax=Westerdykella ornata TaxID=318751 RepID=A0A6A6JSF5_WESOR|nr:uncharacterized protein EI97DRAFT_499541 [Westerdykella ornata]KAF2279043.1 hypothetical protein EI97DRAFT_499541 [Westerdykella ornata]